MEMKMKRMDLWRELDGESSLNVYTLPGLRWIAGEKLSGTGSRVLWSVMT